MAAAEGFMEVARQGSAAVMTWARAWIDGAVAAGGADELPDWPAGRVFGPSADGQGGEDDGQVGFDRVALVVPLVGQEPDGDLRVQAALFGEPGLAEAVPGAGLEIQQGITRL